MKLSIEIEREENGEWIAEIPEVPGVMALGKSPALAVREAILLLMRVLADKIEHGELAADENPGAIELPLVHA